MAQMTAAAKLAAWFIGGASVLGIGVVSGIVPVPDLTANQPAEVVVETPVAEPVPPPETQAPEAELETALVIPPAPVITNPPTLPMPSADVIAEPVVPAFDLLRVEPNGSVVIAGTAAPGSIVEAITGARSLGRTTAAANGDFAIIFDEQLAAGDYEIVLRADGPDGSVATSLQTAIVSIPQAPSGGVLALVEEPGAPSRLISAGEGTAEPLAAVAPPEAPIAATEPNIMAQETSPERVPLVAPGFDVRIEAVEIDGQRVFVAGAAEPGARLRLYANDILLGEVVASPNGRFLVEVNRDLEVGDYMIRADLLSANGADVVMRAAVPFERQPGERLAAIAVQPVVTLPSDAPSIDDAQGSEIKPQNVAPLPDTPPVINGTGEADDTVATQVQQALSPAKTSVIIRRGDTLWQISRRVYGQGVKFTTIYNANTDQIRDPNRIWPGQVFAVPEEAEAN